MTDNPVLKKTYCNNYAKMHMRMTKDFRNVCSDHIKLCRKFCKLT